MTRLRYAIFALAFAVPSLATALQVRSLEVTRSGGVYHVALEALIDAPLERVRAVLLDANAMVLIDPSLKSAVATPESDGLRVQSELEECLFGFCRRLLHVQKVQATGNDIRAQTLAVQGSGFRSGQAHWQLSPEASTTKLVFAADTEPAVWLPPLIGPPALMAHLREKAQHSLHQLEQLARE